MIGARKAICIAAILSSLLIAARPAAAQDVPPPVDQAIERGLDFLAHHQNPDGSFESDGPKIALTGLSVMSFLAAGHVPEEGKYGAVVRAGMDYLIKTSPPDGYWGRVDGSRMYGQGIATLALAEAYGADHDPRHRQLARDVLSRAVAVIFAAQDFAKVDPFAGGWRYEPTNPDSDLSLSGWCALSLRAAAAVGIDVPPERVQRALTFVMRCYRPDQGGFCYQPGREAAIAMTGVGMLNLYLFQGAQRPELAPAARFLMTHPVADDTKLPFYALYYSTQAAFQAGDPTWSVVWRVTQSRLLPIQNPDGGWPQSTSSEEPGRVYATSMSLLTLTVPYRILPIYQR